MRGYFERLELTVNLHFLEPKGTQLFCLNDTMTIETAFS